MWNLSKKANLKITLISNTRNPNFLLKNQHNNILCENKTFDHLIGEI